MATLKAARIKPGTTPLLTVTVEGEAIQDSTLTIAIAAGGRVLLKSNYYDDGSITAEPVYNESLIQTGTLISVQYSQAETLMLRPGHAEIEVGWANEDGTSDKSDIGRIFIPKTLIKGVMAYAKH